MFNQAAESVLKAIGLLACWLTVGLIATLFVFPVWEVLKVAMVGLAPFLVAGGVVGLLLVYDRLTEPEWRKHGRASRRLASKQVQQNCQIPES